MTDVELAKLVIEMHAPLRLIRRGKAEAVGHQEVRVQARGREALHPVAHARVRGNGEAMPLTFDDAEMREVQLIDVFRQSVFTGKGGRCQGAPAIPHGQFDVQKADAGRRYKDHQTRPWGLLGNRVQGRVLH